MQEPNVLRSIEASQTTEASKDLVGITFANLIKEGIAARNRGTQLQQAEKLFYQALILSSGNGLWSQAVESYCQLSITAYHRYFQRDSTNYLELMYRNAINAFELAKRRHVNGLSKALACNCLGHFWKTQRQYKPALAYYLSARTISEKEDPELDAARGLCMVYRGQPIEGREVINRALRVITGLSNSISEEERQNWASSFCEVLFCQSQAEALASDRGKDTVCKERALMALHEAEVYAQKLAIEWGKPHQLNQFTFVRRSAYALLNLSVDSLEQAKLLEV